MPFALFLDVLGTGRAVTSLADDYQYRDLDETVLGGTQRDFQQGLKHGGHGARQALRFIASFSDSGYLIVDDALAMLHAVHWAMRSFLGRVPVRGGIGYGNFGIGSTMHHWNGSALIAEASFFGSALVRAHRAESCGHKGVRIFVHESAVEGLRAHQDNIAVFPEQTLEGFDEYADDRPESLPGTIVEIPDSQYPDVRYEVCPIGGDNIDLWFRGVEMLELMSKPDAAAAAHYAASRAALKRFEGFRTAV